MDADPLIGPAQNEKFGDYQSNAAMGLAKQITERTGAEDQPPRRRRADQGKPRPRRHGRRGQHRRAGVHQRPAVAGVAGEAVAGDRDGRAAGRCAGGRRRRRSSSITPARTRKGTARRPPAEHDHRRRLQPGHGVPGARRHPPEPPRRLGHAVRDADRHTCRTRAGGGEAIADRRPGSLLHGGQRRFDADPAFQTRPRANGRAACRPATRKSWRLADRSSRRPAGTYQPLYERLGVKLTPERRARRVVLQRVAAGRRDELKAKGIATQSEGARGRLHRRGRGPAHHREDRAAASCTPRPTWRPSVTGCTTCSQPHHLLRGRPPVAALRQVFATARRPAGPPERAAGARRLRHDARPRRQAVQGSRRRYGEARRTCWTRRRSGA